MGSERIPTGKFVMQEKRGVSMAAIKSAEKSASKFVERAAVAGTAYNDGVANPRTDWATATKAAEDNYKTGVQAAASAGRFGKGVSKAGSSKWQKAATDKGSARFASGVASAQEAYSQGFEPYRSKIAALTLPARYPRRDPRNLQRVTAVATALGQLKESTAKS